MLSFSRLSILAVAAFGTLAYALPTRPVVGSVVPSVPGLSTIENAAPAVPGVGSLVRRDQKNVVTIINETTTKVQEFSVEFHYVVAANATLEVLSPIVADIKGVLGDALVDINALVGLSEDVVLGLEGGLLLTVTEVAAAIVGLLTVVLEAVGAVLDVVLTENSDCVLVLLSSLVEVLGCLICAISMLVGPFLGGLITLVVSLLGGLTGILATLKVTVLISIFGALL
ncbi:hypothetical protein C8Q72DRAFT_799263 [Fomitopsis betulina]|nr:hypothetical protein C8Q72DRAFT_799263 [Fomitopsis betulina]